MARRGRRPTWRDSLARVGSLLAQQPRQRLLAGGGALVLMLICGTVVAFSLTPKHTPPTRNALSIAPTDTSTGTATLTVTVSPTATTRPKPTATHTKPKPPPLPTPPPVPPTPTSVPGVPSVTPTPCGPGNYLGNNPTQAEIRTALQTAGSAYGIPVNLMYATAWQESRWHQDVYSCDGGIGLMQIQYYTAPWLNQQSVPVCNIGATNYDVHTAQGNAYLGAKYLKYLSCYWAYWGANGGTSIQSPGSWTSAWYYKNYPQAQQPPPPATPAPSPTATPTLAPRPYPDTSVSGSFCAVPFGAHAFYADLPSTGADPWSCPYSAATGDNTLLDVTVSSYNAGPGVTANGINNWGYVNSVEGYITQFSTGALPTAS
jgi:hypothetical protein